MARLTLALFDGLRITVNDRPIEHFRTNKGRALLAYLAVEADRPHEREKLAALLWPDVSPHSAFSNLRKALTRVRIALDAYSPGLSDTLFTATRHSITLHSSQIWLDVAEAARALSECALHRHAPDAQDEWCLERLNRVVQLYQGEFLAGVLLEDAPAWEEWVTTQQTHWHHLVLDVLFRLTATYLRQGEYASAQYSATRQLALEPWRELAHRQLMLALALDGQRSAALVQWETCRAILRKELGIEPDESTRSLYAAIKRNDVGGWRETLSFANAAKPDTSRQAPRLPAQLTPFFGRTQELILLTTLLRDPSYRLVSVVGEGGVGKTRLALTAASAVQRDFPDGVWWVPLAALTPRDESIESHHDLLTMALVRALALPIQSKSAAVVQLLHYLQGQKLLLVLDNFEHLQAGATWAIDLLHHLPELSILITSRHPLHLQAEYILRVEGLPVPSPTDTDAEIASSVQLFMERARRRSSKFALHEQWLPHILDICRAVHGLPLGIELAAGLTEYLPIEQIAPRIRDDMDLLVTTMPDVPPRQRSMRALFMHSWNLLSDAARRALRRASVFRGTFDATAAQFVTQTDMETLTSLVSHSLIQHLQDRYELHRHLQRLASEMLAESPTDQLATNLRHAEYYLNLLAQQESRLLGTEVGHAVALIRAESDNIQSAWQWAVAGQQLDLLLKAHYPMNLFYAFQERRVEGEQIFAQAISQVRQVAHAQATQDHRWTELLASLVSHHTFFLQASGRYAEAVEAARELIALGVRLTERRIQARGYLWLGRALQHIGDDETSYHALTQAVALARAEGNWLLAETESLRNLGRTAIQLGAYEEARTRLQQARTLLQSLSYRRSEGITLLHLGLASEMEGQYEQAQEWYETAQHLFAQMDDLWGVASALHNLGTISLFQGNYLKAQRLTDESYRLFQLRHDEQEIVHTMIVQGIIALRLGKIATASSTIEKAWRTSSRLAYSDCTGHALVHLALLENRAARFEVAEAHSREAWQILRRVGRHTLEGAAFTMLARALVGQARFTEAADAYQTACAWYARRGQLHLVAEPCAALADLYWQEGRTADALATIEPLLPTLWQRPLGAALEPFRTYLIVWRLLDHAGDSRAPLLLHHMHALLQQQSSELRESGAQQLFITRNSEHREILSVYARVAPIPNHHS